MVDPPTYRAEPDPTFAARLERLLLQRLAEGSDEPRSNRRGAASDGPLDTHPYSDDELGDLIMLETEDRPTHQPPPSSGRGSQGRWLMVAAAAAVAAVIGTVVVAAGDDDDTVDTADSPTPTTTPVVDWADVPDGTTYAPGRYFVDPDADPTTPLRVTFQVTADGWNSWPGAYKQQGGNTGFSIADIANLTTDACTDHTPLDPPVGPTVDDLATALTQLPPFTVAAPPTDVTIDGYHGKHLTLTTTGSDLRVIGTGNSLRFADCLDGGNLHSWIFAGVGGPFYGYAAVPDIREQFWILDVDGTRLVLVKLDSPSSPAQDVAERDAMFDSIDIEP